MDAAALALPQILGRSDRPCPHPYFIACHLCGSVLIVTHRADKLARRSILTDEEKHIDRIETQLDQSSR